MNTRFQSALSHIKADETLINKTEMYLRERLAENQNSKVVRFPKYKLKFIKNLAKAACILFILVGGGTVTYAISKTPVSYLSLDINPSIEFGVNAFNRVVTADGYNTDGKTVLTGLDVKGTKIGAAVSTVILSAAENGFIENDGSTVVSLTSETDDLGRANKLYLEAEAGVNKALEKKGKTAIIYKDSVSLKLRDEARGLNIAPGKLNLIKKLQAANPIATIDQYKDAKVKDIMKAMQVHTDNIIVYNKDKSTVTNKEAIASSKEAIASSKEAVVSSKDKSTVTNKDKGDVSSKKESAVTNKDKGTANSKKESAKSTTKSEAAADNKNKEAANNAASNIITDTVNSNSETDISNKQEKSINENKKGAVGNAAKVPIHHK